MAPPTLAPWPSMYFVVGASRCRRHSMGRQFTGVGNVLSTISGTPCACAAAAGKRSMSSTASAGFAMASPNTAFVFSRNAASSSSSVQSGRNERAFQAHALHGHGQQVVRAAVDGRAGYDMIARAGDVEPQRRSSQPGPTT